MNHNLNTNYSRENWIDFLQNEFLPNDFSIRREQIDIEFKSKYIKPQAYWIGDCESLGDLAIIEVSHSSINDPRIGVSRDAFRLMAEHGLSKALFFFVSDNSKNYRFSLITIDLKLEGKDVKYLYSSPKRLSFYLGEEAKLHTPKEFLFKKGKITNFEDLQNRFSIEVVNKEFYGEIQRLFYKLVGGKVKRGSRDIEFDPMLKLPSTNDHKTLQEFSVRLVGRLVFCWFLKKKKSDNGIPLIPENVLSSKAISNNYYHNIIEPLFFEMLNTKIEERKEKFRTDEFDLIPFLNGGLFDPQLHQDYYDLGPDENTYHLNTLKVPDEWLEEFIAFLETYNFTIDENTSIDIDLSVDPEMLGRIFENLLAEINPETGDTARKSTGSYYTPRPIVEYMVDESLIQYLLTKTEIEEQHIRELLDYKIEDTELTRQEKISVIDALDEIKVLDPACGSGAFPMGILQKMLLILQKVDPESIEWVMRQLDKIPNKLVRETLEEKLMNENWKYKHKMGIIQNAIYGVDIQPVATEISKLRLFLTLIVDENIRDDELNRNIHPLPNLSFKFVTANTLIVLPKAETDEQMNLMNFDNILDPLMKKLESLREEFFYASGDDKVNIEKEFIKTQKEIGQFQAENRSTNKRATALVNWNPFNDSSSSWFDHQWMFGIENGFDIVIGNPPYINSKKLKHINKLLRSYKTYSGSADIYVYFYECAINHLNKTGTLCYITSNKWIRSEYGRNLRDYFICHTNPILLIDFSTNRLFDATVDSNIIFVEKNKNSQQFLTCCFDDKINYDTFKSFIKKNSISGNHLTSDTWLLSKGEKDNIRNKIEKVKTCLKDHNVKIYRGILTGLNEAFIIDSDTKEHLITLDVSNKKIIKPLLRGKDIKSFENNWSGLWLINTHNGYRKNNKFVNRIDTKTQYPVLFDYLSKFLPKIQERQDKGEHWSNLRNCAYIDEFEKEKILWQGVSKRLEFSFDSGNFFCDVTAFMMVGEDLKYYLSIFNSHLFEYCLIHIYLENDTFKSKNQIIQNFPIPLVSKKVINKVSTLIDQILHCKKAGKDTLKLEDHIDLMVYKLYELTYDEVLIVDPECPFSKEEYEKFKFADLPEDESIIEKQTTTTTSEIQEPESEDNKSTTSDILLEFTVGQHVIHPTFGEGEVQHVAGSGEKATIHVKFGKQTKKLVAGYAKLRGV